MDRLMSLPLSQLIFARFREGLDPRRVIALHRHNAFLDQMREIGLAVNPDGTVIGLQASKGVYLSRDVVGYTWFIGPLHQPSPVHFGDAMQEIERFLWDEFDRQATGAPIRPFLIGEEQGGMMALAMAAAVPDLLSGVVAIGAMLPVVPGWEPPLAALDGLPILLVNPTSASPASGPETVVSVETLTSWGGQVDQIEDPSGHVPLDRIREWVADQEPRTLRT